MLLMVELSSVWGGGDTITALRNCGQGKENDNDNDVQSMQSQKHKGFLELRASVFKAA